MFFESKEIFAYRVLKRVNLFSILRKSLLSFTVFFKEEMQILILNFLFRLLLKKYLLYYPKYRISKSRLVIYLLIQRP
jgi:hypothetical protein